MAPSPERYKEIQEALASNGYGKGAPDGSWTPAWADALKSFQRDKNLEATGKLNSLSLIALGLGPKRDTGVVTTPPGRISPPAESPKRESQ